MCYLPKKHLIGAVCALLLLSHVAPAQPVSPQPSQIEDETVVLSPFAVQERADLGRYQASQVSSGTRVRMDLMESTQSISVVTRELIEDISADRVLDAAKYSAAITENTSPHLQNRMTVRGFQSNGVTLDGFRIALSFAPNQDPVVIDRMEIVKGPNAIISPSGVPGGLVNNVTKKPHFTGNKGYVSYQAGRWDANRMEMDANYVVLKDKLAMRLVGSYQDSTRYEEYGYRSGWTVMPMLTWRASPSTEVTVQFQGFNEWILSPWSPPISVYARGRTNVRIQEGLPRDFGISPDADINDAGYYSRLSVNTKITDRLSMRVAGNYVNVKYKGQYVLAAPDFEVVSVDQLTGEWVWDGVTFNDNPAYITDGARVHEHGRQANFQNDFAYEFEGPSWKSKTVAGYALNWRGVYPRPSPSFEPNPNTYDLVAGERIPAGYTLRNTWGAGSASRNRDYQYYLYQVVNLLDDKLVLSGSLSYNEYASARQNYTSGARTKDTISTTLPAAGIVYKVTPQLSAYYGYSEQGVPDGPDFSNGVPHHVESSTQHEVGVRVRLADGKLYATLAYFDLKISDVYMWDLRNYTAPIPDPLYPAIKSDRTVDGVEFEFTWSPTPQLSFVGNIAHNKNRDGDGMQFANIADDSAAIWASYAFSDTGPLAGLRIGIGADYLGERAGTTHRWTTPPLGFTPVRIQPSFYVPSRTLVNASANYRINKHWSAQLNVTNLTDEDYIMGANGRGIDMGTPINARLTIRYDF